MKYNAKDNLLYCGKYLSVNSERGSVPGTVAEEKNFARTWLFKHGVFEPYKVLWCHFAE